MLKRTTRRVSAVGAVAALALVTSGCLQSDDGGSGGGSASGETGDGTVTILGAFGGPEGDAFRESLAEFEEESGITVEYTDDQNFTETVVQRVTSGDAPDIGIFPQPGGLLELSDEMAPLQDFLDVDSLEESLVPGFLDFTKDGSDYYGAPMRLAVKSIVWYPKEAYEKGGYNTEPASLEEMQEITDEIKADGIDPWCMGWESDQATGWVGTDWLEEYVLRTAGGDVYDQWVNHEIPFDDPQIAEALDAYGEIAKTEGQVYGGTQAILNTAFGDAFTPAFDPEPKCMVMRQGNFITGFFPEDVQADLDNSVGVYSFPPMNEGDDQPVLVGGDIAAVFNGEDEDTQAVMEFLTSDQFGGPWAEAGGWLSPHTTFDQSLYVDDTTRSIAEIANEADFVRYDASDQMPQVVGSGSFWTGMVEWVNGTDTDEALANIESTWPAE